MIESLISNAIHGQRLIRLEYDGKPKTVEPHLLGRTDKNVEALLCRQVSPAFRDGLQWQLLDLRKIYGLLVLDQRFEVAPGDCNPPLEMFSTTQKMEVETGISG